MQKISFRDLKIIINAKVNDYSKSAKENRESIKKVDAVMNLLRDLNCLNRESIIFNSNPDKDELYRDLFLKEKKEI